MFTSSQTDSSQSQQDRTLPQKPSISHTATAFSTPLPRLLPSPPDTFDSCADDTGETGLHARGQPPTTGTSTDRDPDVEEQDSKLQPDSAFIPPVVVADGENTGLTEEHDVGLSNTNAHPIEPIRTLSAPFRKLDVPLGQLPPVSTATHASKHPRPEDAIRVSVLERPQKRNRPKPRPKNTIDSEAFQAAIRAPKAASPPSPLFFSNTQRPRPLVPPGFSSTEAAARMLKPRDEPDGVTTLKLARGSISAAASSPRSNGTPGSLASLGSPPRSPEQRGRSPGMQILGSVGIIELLEQDERPTFIIDIANPMNFNAGGPLVIVFANASLRGYEGMLEMVNGNEGLESPGIVNDFPEFKMWALSFVKNNEAQDICLPSFTFGGLTWSCRTLRKRLRLISGSGSIMVMGAGSSSSNGATTASSSPASIEKLPRSLQARVPVSRSPLTQSSEPTDYFGDATVQPDSPSMNVLSHRISSPMSLDQPSPANQSLTGTQSVVLTSDTLISRFPESSSFDWTKLSISVALPPHIRFALGVDWSATPLGPIETWGFNLRAMCNLVMGSPHPAAMYWGDDDIAIYNEGYIMLAGQKHPDLMGCSYKVAWAEIWDEVKGVFASAKQSGQSTMKGDDRLFIRRNGYLEETYFSWSIIPLIGEDGSVQGLYNPSFEMTRRKLAERRMLTLREIGDKAGAARDVKSFWGQVIKGLEYNEFDVPFVFLYSVCDDQDSDMSSMYSGSIAQSPQCILEGTLGVPQGHKAAVSPLDLKTSDEGFAPYLREAMKTNRPVLLTIEDGSLSKDLIDGLEWRGFGDPCRSAVVCAIHPTTGESVLLASPHCFIVIGVNPRRPYDDDYSLFIQLLSRQLSTSIASTMLFEEEIRRGQRAARLAALDRQELSKQLDLRTQEKVESETKFTRMAEFAPVGMFIANSIGQITYSNDTWWEISRHPRGINSADTWMQSIKEEDREEVKNIWATLVDRKTAVTHEFRFKTPWEDSNGNMGDTWVLMSAYPEKDDDGKLKSVFGSITNISSQKSVEDFQKKRMEEAIELKRQQENFIDITSHEMRNPLSAILQCSDEIATSLAGCKARHKDSNSTENLFEVLDSSIDAAQTIALCAQHQKRIVDDILTLSKLDSALLVVTPVKVHPVEVVQRALKMFGGELDTNDIAMELRIENSYLDLQVDRVKLDPSRLLQVLINLTTNAIKFTNLQEKRTIIVSVGASKDRPDGSESGVTYFPSRSKSKEVTTDDAEWGTGDNIFLLFAVQDTGRGLDEKEKTILFQRFRQASPRTHVQYGGSGLGLFISRELTELQGGEIGVSSERGVGSTFAFYVRARKVESDEQNSPVTDKMSELRRGSSSSAIILESRRNSSGKAVARANTVSHNISRPPVVPAITVPLPISSSLDFTKILILIVEDNLVNQRVLRKQLANSGFLTQVANHGGEALDILKTTRFWEGNDDGVELGVILMDLEMPVMDGLAAARIIREMEVDGRVKGHVPIIAVTANARLEQIEDAMAAGMDDVVSKPFRIPDLTPKIEELVLKTRKNIADASAKHKK